MQVRQGSQDKYLKNSYTQKQCQCDSDQVIKIKEVQHFLAKFRNKPLQAPDHFHVQEDTLKREWFSPHRSLEEFFMLLTK